MNNLAKNNANLEPVAVIYNITSGVVESAVVEFLRKLNIDVLAVKSSVRRVGKDKEVVIHAFFNKNSKDIISKSNVDLGVFAGKMGGSSYKPSPELVEALKAISKSGELSVTKNLIHCKLDIFKCLGIMLAADFRYQEIYINGIQNQKDEGFIMEVIKGVKYPSKNKSRDIYADIMNALTDR